MSAPSPASRRAALRRRFRRLDAWMQHNLTADLTVQGLAGRVLMSPASFAKAYRELMGTTPAKMVERLRIDAATRLLAELSDSPVSAARVGHLVGFGCAESFKRAFRRQHGMSPDQWLELDAITSPGGRMTEDQEKALLEAVDTIDKRLLCLSVNLDRQVGWLFAELRTQLDRIEVLVGGNPPPAPLQEEPADAEPPRP